jgi:hypothetical protein
LMIWINITLKKRLQNRQDQETAQNDVQMGKNDFYSLNSSVIQYRSLDIDSATLVFPKDNRRFSSPYWTVRSEIHGFHMKAWLNQISHTLGMFYSDFQVFSLKICIKQLRGIITPIYSYRSRHHSN